MTTSPAAPSVGSSRSSPAFARVLAAVAALAAFAVASALFGEHGLPSTLAALAIALAAGVLAFRQATLLLAALVTFLPLGLFVGAVAGLWIR